MIIDISITDLKVLRAILNHEEAYSHSSNYSDLGREAVRRMAKKIQEVIDNG